MMLFGGFGFLMTFLKRYGLSSIGFTMIIIVEVTQFSLIVFGILRMDTAEEFVIKIGFLDVVEAGLVSAAVLISFGVLIGKVNPFQLLVLGLLEAVACIANMHLGYTTLGVVDVGGSIFVHTFGAYFGLAVSFCLRYLEIIRLPLTKSRMSRWSGGRRRSRARTWRVTGTPATSSPSSALSSSGSSGPASTGCWRWARPGTGQSSTPTSGDTALLALGNFVNLR